jgi:hypothetical protein
MSAFQSQIQDRRSRQFYGASTMTLLQRADVAQKLILESSFDVSFYLLIFILLVVIVNSNFSGVLLDGK